MNSQSGMSITGFLGVMLPLSGVVLFWFGYNFQEYVNNNLFNIGMLNLDVPVNYSFYLGAKILFNNAYQSLSQTIFWYVLLILGVILFCVCLVPSEYMRMEWWLNTGLSYVFKILMVAAAFVIILTEPWLMPKKTAIEFIAKQYNNCFKNYPMATLHYKVDIKTYGEWDKNCPEKKLVLQNNQMAYLICTSDILKNRQKLFLAVKNESVGFECHEEEEEAYINLLRNEPRKKGEREELNTYPSPPPFKDVISDKSNKHEYTLPIIVIPLRHIARIDLKPHGTFSTAYPKEPPVAQDTLSPPRPASSL